MRNEIVIGTGTYKMTREFKGTNSLHDLIVDTLSRRIEINPAALTHGGQIKYNNGDGSVDMKEA